MRRSVSLVAAALGILVVPANAGAQSSPGYGAAASTQPGSCTDTTGTGPCQIKFDVPNVQFVGGQGQDVSTSVSYANSSATLSAPAVSYTCRKSKAR